MAVAVVSVCAGIALSTCPPRSDLVRSGLRGDLEAASCGGSEELGCEAARLCLAKCLHGPRSLMARLEAQVIAAAAAEAERRELETG